MTQAYEIPKLDSAAVCLLRLKMQESGLPLDCSGTNCDAQMGSTCIEGNTETIVQLRFLLSDSACPPDFDPRQNCEDANGNLNLQDCQLEDTDACAGGCIVIMTCPISESCNAFDNDVRVDCPGYVSDECAPFAIA